MVSAGVVRGDTPLPDDRVAHPAVRAGLAVAEVYKRVVTGPLEPMLARSRPVRRTGFEREVVVAEITPVADDVVSLTLRCPGGGELTAWQPGSHLDVVLPSGRQRQYSLCGDPSDRRSYRIAVRRLADGGGGSREIHDDLEVGDVITIRGPRNAFRLAEASAYFFVAGGIGITPILPMVQAAEASGRPWTLVYTGRSRASMPFLDGLATLRGGALDVRPDDECGIPDLDEILADVPRGHAVYVCGPPAMLDTARTRLAAPDFEVHSERFSAPPVIGGEAFDVELRRSGVTIPVAADQSVLAAVRDQVPDLAYSCQQGFCGTCVVKVVDGDVEHRDRALLDSEREDSMLICVSRCSGPLVLDL
ncbi:oxidoreductase [Nocardioides humilatus]|uniref:Oxidoreductase n=1 Tax=Nocardioides humilatus TaxID=2607660 RepID=A0A5B1L9R1_9ACTN|nr:PDR/VanB family oxidoreductase [Nocardioides humilatus]KAA1416948.1 oxidoreductase [Nocardioides humilatus]